MTTKIGTGLFGGAAVTKNLKECWKNVAQAAQWLAEGREVEARWRVHTPTAWSDLGSTSRLSTEVEYRLKPESPKPMEVWVWKFHHGQLPVAAAYKNKKQCESEFAKCEGKPVLLREVLPE